MNPITKGCTIFGIGLVAGAGLVLAAFPSARRQANRQIGEFKQRAKAKASGALSTIQREALTAKRAVTESVADARKTARRVYDDAAIQAAQAIESTTNSPWQARIHIS